MLFVVSKKEYKALDKQNTELLNVIIQKNKSIEDKEEDIENKERDIKLLKIKVANIKIENESKDRYIRSLEDSNRLSIGRIRELEEELALTKKTHSGEITHMRGIYNRAMREKQEFKRKYEEELNKREEAEANLSKAVARNMVDDMTIKELEHHCDKLETIIEALKSNIQCSREIKRQILDYIEIKDEKGNIKIEKGCVLVHANVSGVHMHDLARLI